MSEHGDGPRQEDPPLRVLLVEDDAAEAERIRGLLAGAGGSRVELAHAPKLQTALALLGRDGYDAALVALDAARDGDASPVRRIRELSAIPILGLARGRDAGPVLEALRAGAHDCLLRDECTAPVLVRALLHAVERRQLLDQLEGAQTRERYLATHDATTGLPNRFLFEDELRRSLLWGTRNRRPVAVLFVGLDRFGQVNDSLGHGAGDELLAQVGARLRGALRKSDGVARLGGDEFVVLVDDISRGQDASRVARELRDAVAASYRVSGREFWVTPSIGIAVFPRDGSDPEALIRNAHAAMREAKGRGGDASCFFSASMDETNRKRLQLETRLRRALERDELELHYQPKVEIESGRITGAEALLRWTDPELGPVEPKAVIPIAEETGLISAIGEWSLRTACAQNVEWLRAGLGRLRVSVNLSARQIADDGLREMVVRALWDTGLEPSQLELEITESSLMQNEEVAVRLLEDLKRVGVAVSLDDFGTGFSSLSYLKRFPVDILKIDQSFVRDIALDADDAAIVGAIISIAQNLELGVIAEGVETEQQRAFLRARGCPEMQGFLMSPAIPAADFSELLRKQAATLPKA
jgi:diguanylate cyclase (GGDEF)-like protein